MKPTEMPAEPWLQVSGDFYGPIEDGTFYFVNYDKHSRNVFVHNIKSVAEFHVIPVLEELFALFGVPAEYQSDNGSPFQSLKFKEFALGSGFKHRLTTPLWPRANGEVERFMRNLGKVLRNAKLSGTKREVAIRQYLQAYRATPHSTTGVPPNQLFLGFSRTVGLPQTNMASKDLHAVRKQAYETAMANDGRAKARMEAEYNVRMKAQACPIQVDDLVLMKLRRENKLTPEWDPEPWTVTAVKGSMISVEKAGKRYTRNSSFFKLYLYEHVLPTIDTQVTVLADEVKEHESEEREASETVVEAVPAKAAAPVQALVNAEVPAGVVANKRPGRPTNAQTEANKIAADQDRAAYEQAHPEMRRSARNKAGVV
jgi:hypothetical protein